jgi:hypothetical protein
MHQWGKEGPPRKLVWAEGLDYAGWDAPTVHGFYDTSSWPVGNSLEEIIEKSQTQLANDFASHSCDKHPVGKGSAKPKSI